MDNATAVCAPGAYHRARWTAKGIYCLKLFGFRDQFQMSKYEMDSLRRICLFVCTIYADFWFATPLVSAAPMNDLQMLQLIELYVHVDSKIAKVGESKMRLHLWYLSEDLAALPLFGSDTTNEDKKAIVDVLQREPFPEDVRRVTPTKCSKFSDLSLAQFVTQRSLNLFKSLQLSQDFLSVAVDTWDKCDDYTASCKIIHALKAVNDCAERAVKLATDFNEVLTKEDKQRQLLYQVIEHYRKLLPTSATKAQLTKSKLLIHPNCLTYQTLGEQRNMQLQTVHL